MTDQTKAEAIKDEVAAYLEDQRLYFKKLRTWKEIEDERLHREANKWDEGDKEASVVPCQELSN